MLVIIAIVENIHPSPPNKPPAFFFLGIYVAVLPTALETVLGGGGGGGEREAERALTQEQCSRGGKSWEQRKWDRSGAGGETEMLPVSLSCGAKFEQSLTMDLCKKSKNIPGSHSSKQQPA